MKHVVTQPRGGFALVITLGLVAIVGATLARIASLGLDLVLEGRTQERQLQEEWAERSCRIALLENASDYFEQSDARSEAAGLGWPYPDTLLFTFTLNSVSYDGVLVDEQARVNLNAVHQRDSPQVLSFLLAARHETQLDVPIRHNAIGPLVARGGPQPAYSSLGQIIDLSRLADRRVDAPGLVAFASRFTLGQDQRLNVRRASDNALNTTASLALTAAEAEELVQSRRGRTGDLRAWLDASDLPARRLGGLRRLLGDQSTAYSLWVWSDSPPRVTMAAMGLRRGQRTPRVLRWP